MLLQPKTGGILREGQVPKMSPEGVRPRGGRGWPRRRSWRQHEGLLPVASMYLRGNLLLGSRVENGLEGRGVGGWREGAGPGEGGRFPHTHTKKPKTPYPACVLCLSYRIFSKSYSTLLICRFSEVPILLTFLPLHFLLPFTLTVFH